MEGSGQAAVAPLLRNRVYMRDICQNIKSHVLDVLVRWEGLMRQQPWYSLPADHRIDNLPEVIVGLAEAALCRPADREAHRQKVSAACTHGEHRRRQGIPDHLILTEYHLLRQALWYYLVDTYGSSDRTVQAIMLLDTALTLATNASMWGYHRAEIEALGKWEEGIERIISSSPLLRVAAS
jgi:hypothetical protein